MRAVWMLVVKDLLHLRKGMLVNLAILVFMALLIVTGGASPSMLGALLPVLVMVTTMGILYEEERSNGLQFLRSLPLSPAVVVAGKFVAVLASLALYAAAGLGLLAALGRMDDVLWGPVLASAAAALLLGGAAGVAFYRYGYLAIRWLFTGGFLLVMSVTVLVRFLSRTAFGPAAWLRSAAPWVLPALGRLIEWAAAGSLRAGLLGATGLLLAYVFLGWLAVRGLARREL